MQQPAEAVQLPPLDYIKMNSLAHEPGLSKHTRLRRASQIDKNTLLAERLLAEYQRPRYSRKRTTSLPGTIAQEGSAGPSPFITGLDQAARGGSQPVRFMHSDDWNFQTDVVADSSGAAVGRSHRPPNVTFVKVPKVKPPRLTYQEIYDAALRASTPELDALRIELGIPVGTMPALPSRSHPWLRHWARPLVARFEYLVGVEMKHIQRRAREDYKKLKASAPVDIIPVIQPIVEVAQT